ncbi:hypothetical protein UP17_21230 [Peribacillus simplex]|nr:hypothetical protein UP17_21230 [Peribacillus simplex]
MLDFIFPFLIIFLIRPIHRLETISPRLHVPEAAHYVYDFTVNLNSRVMKSCDSASIGEKSY